MYTHARRAARTRFFARSRSCAAAVSPATRIARSGFTATVSPRAVGRGATASDATVARTDGDAEDSFSWCSVDGRGGAAAAPGAATDGLALLDGAAASVARSAACFVVAARRLPAAVGVTGDWACSRGGGGSTGDSPRGGDGSSERNTGDTGRGALERGVPLLAPAGAPSAAAAAPLRTMRDGTGDPTATTATAGAAQGAAATTLGGVLEAPDRLGTPPPTEPVRDTSRVTIIGETSKWPSSDGACAAARTSCGVSVGRGGRGGVDGRAAAGAGSRRACSGPASASPPAPPASIAPPSATSASVGATGGGGDSRCAPAA